MKANQATVNRLLKTARGQLDGILKMVEEDRYCIDIYNQLSATQAIISKANREIIKGHLDGCVKDALESDNEMEKDKKLTELSQLLEKFLK